MRDGGLSRDAEASLRSAFSVTPCHPSIPPGARVFSVTDLNGLAGQTLQEVFGTVWVAGEIADWSGRHRSGHVYFSLKDAGGCLSAALWKSNAYRLPAGVQFRTGLAVVAMGKLTIYAPQGRYQLIVERLLPVGLGEADEALRRLKQKLLQQGYFAQERKRPIPDYPRRVALVTSPSGAAVRDMLAVLTTQGRGIDVVLVPVAVQGEAAPAAISAALRRLSSWHDDGTLRVDVVIVGRGGGSSDDLSAFDSEVVADAIVTSPMPVISAVGHESDTTISDLVADWRAATPTKAAEECTRHWGRAESAIARLRKQLATGLARKIDTTRQHLDALAARRVMREPKQRLRDREQGLDGLGQRLHVAVRRLVGRRGEGVRAAAARLNALSPLNVLARGYSLTERRDRRLLRDVADVAVDEVIVTRLHRGQLTSRVLSVEPTQDHRAP
jgi:exodeoxyribonuclease VII large subunit